MSDILLRLSGAEIVAANITKLPESLVVDNNNYQVISSLGDYDCLRDQKEEVVGFSFSISGKEEILVSSLVREAGNVLLKPGELQILLAMEESYKSDGMQGATWIYRYRNQFMIGLHEWGDWGKFGFLLTPLISAGSST